MARFSDPLPTPSTTAAGADATRAGAPDAAGATDPPAPPRTVPTGAAPAAALLLDADDLAVRARTTLAAADHAVVVNAERDVVAVGDQDGEPVLSGAPESLRACAARNRRVSLVIAPRVDDGVWLVLDGLLHPQQAALRLAVGGVWVGCPHGHGHARPLALDSYAQAVPDVLTATAPRLMDHGNTSHPVQLRTLAERRLGVAAGMVAGARMVALDPTGLTLRVVDTVGGHELRLPFAATATDVPSLMTQLRHTVTS